MIFLATYLVQEGRHVHNRYLLINAEDEAEASSKARSQEHLAENQPVTAKLTWWDYGDGLTNSEVDTVVEISKRDANILEKLLGFKYFDEE